MRRYMDFLPISCVVFLALVANGCCQHAPRHDATRDDLVVLDMLDDVLRSSGEADIPQTLLNMGLTTLYDRLEDQQLVGALRGPGPLTVFAPTNEAFSRLRSWNRRRLTNSAYLTRTLRYHVVPSAALTTDWTNDMLLETLSDKSIRINVFPKSDAPTVYTANCVPIVNTDSGTTASNGVVHLVSRLLKIPYGDMITSLEACPVFINFTTAMRMIGWDNLVDGPITVFPPTDYVFQREFPEGVDNLFRNRTALRDLVLSHVVSGTHCSVSLDGGRLTTLSGKILNTVSTEGDITVNGVKLISRDGVVTDGVSHAIQSLLWP